MVVALPMVPRLRWLAPAALIAALIGLLLCWPVVSGPYRASLSHPSNTIPGDSFGLRRTASLLQPYTTLTGPSLPTSRFGSDIAVSQDGDTVAIGGEGDDEGRGGAWIFARTGNSLVQVGAKLTPSPQRFKAASGRLLRVTNFGASLALSADGDTLLVDDNPLDGPLAAWVFTRVDGTWQQQGPALTPSRSPAGGSSNARVALSGDGHTAALANLIGGQYEVLTFVRAGGHWRRHGPPLGSSAPPALSGDGRTLLLGTLVFSRTHSGWRQMARLGGLDRNESASNATLSADGKTALIVTSVRASGSTRSFTLFYGRTTSDWRKLQRVSAPTSDGESVSLSRDGTTAVVGSPPSHLVPPIPNGTKGFASVFTRTSATKWVQAASLQGLEGPVALASDGSTIFAAPGSETGAPAKIFTRSGTGWTEQDAAADPNDATGTDAPAFGGSFAISADGNTALVAEGDGAWIFGRAGTSWVRQTRLETEGATGAGTIVAMSANGETAVVAGPWAPGPVAAWVFSRQGGSWTTHGTPLVAGGAGPRPPGSAQELENFASSVAVSGDGDTILVGAEWDSGNTGAAWVFARSGAGWMQQGPKLTATSPSEGESFGDSVALSSDGEVALVGAAGNRQRPPEGDPAEGAADVFARSAGVWAQTAKLTNGEHDYGWGFGRTVALSADGNTALIGAHGRAIIYYSGSAGWSEHHPALEADPYEDNAVYGGTNAFGSMVALSGDGTRALVGAPAEEGCGRYDNESCSDTATVWAFTRQAEAWVREPLPLVREASFGAQVALSGDGTIGLISGRTPGPEPGGGVLVSEITPLPESGFEVEPAPRVGYEGVVQIQLWSAVPAHFKVIARDPSRQLYGTATATGAGDLSLHIRPSRFFKRYFKRHKHVLLSITISQAPENHSAAARRTLTLPVTFEAFSPEV
jgi:FG-GAP repeat